MDPKKLTSHMSQWSTLASYSLQLDCYYVYSTVCVSPFAYPQVSRSRDRSVFSMLSWR